MLRAIIIKNRVAGLKRLFTISAIKETLRVVAKLVTLSIHEDLPTVDWGRAVEPRIDTQGTITTIKVALWPIAFFVAVVVAGFFSTPLGALLLSSWLDSEQNCLFSNETAKATSRIDVKKITILSSPSWTAEAGVVSDAVLALSTVQARVAFTLITTIELAM